MTDNPTPASLRSLGSDDDEPRVPAGTSQVAYPWIDRITITAENEVTIAYDTLDPAARGLLRYASTVAEDDTSPLRLGAIALRRSDPEGWGYACSHQEPAVDGSRMYRSRTVAAQACAIQAIEGHGARYRFDRGQPLPVTARRRPAQP